MKVKSESEVAQSCLTLSDPMDCSLPGSSIHGIFQARVLEWVAISFSLPCFRHTQISIAILVISLKQFRSSQCKESGLAKVRNNKQYDCTERPLIIYNAAKQGKGIVISE